MSIDKITNDDALSQSKDLVQDNIDKLKALFPEIVTEGKIDFKVLQQVLGEELEEEEEYYRFTWAGKSQARREAHKPSTGTLRPAKEESLDWDTTQNMYIEGDNLEVLKLLQKSYAGKIKMIYIDPPYNTGKDFVYRDNYKDNLKNYQEVTGQIDSEGNKTSTNSDSDGRYHSNWLNMMYPRLRLARNLLKDDGVIFMSIDDNEVSNLIQLLNNIFGESNKIEVLKWKRKKQPSFLAKHTAKVMEYVLVYSKSNEKLEKLSIDKTSDSTKKVINLSNPESTRIFKKGVRVKLDGKGIIKKGRYQIRTMEVEYSTDVFYDGGITLNEVNVISKFSTSQENINKFIDNKLLFITSNLGLRRDVGEDEKGKRKSITDLLLTGWGDNQDSDNELREIFGSTDFFDYTKPTKLVSNLVKSNFSEDEIVLDFFSGSATTAHSVINQNIEDNSKRKYILIQLPEELDENSESSKAGFFNLSDIGKERIRRVVQKIKEENPEKSKEMDLGFKVFKLDSSNIKSWDGNPENLETSLFDAVGNIKTDRTEEDVLYEILLKYGLDLNLTN